ncbi:MAG: hypothetical protein R3246_17075, partial [Acidimicrobiia bacterium]|nr:hypothetical protein [Acidimicrobiia bacterium]
MIHLTGQTTSATQSANARIAYGCMTAAGDQWALGYHNQSLNSTTEVSGGQWENRCLAGLTTGGTTAGQVDFEASFVSMNANGFTVNIDDAPDEAILVASLCIDGFDSAKAGRFTAPVDTAPYVKTVTGVGFDPVGVLFATGDIAQEAISGRDDDAFLMLGASDETNDVCAAAASNFAVTTTQEKSISGNFRTILVMPSDEAGFGTLKARARVKSFNDDGFSFDVRKHEAGISDPITIEYLAVDLATKTIDSTGRPRSYVQAHFNPATSSEKVLMLTDRSAWIYNTGTGVFDATSEAYSADTRSRWGIANTQDVLAWTRIRTNPVNIRTYDGSAFGALI